MYYQRIRVVEQQTLNLRAVGSCPTRVNLFFICKSQNFQSVGNFLLHREGRQRKDTMNWTISETLPVLTGMPQVPTPQVM